jgi:low temperature requirement protein LtrA
LPFVLASRGDDELRGAVLRLTPTPLLGTTLILAASLAPSSARGQLWLAGAAVDFTGPLLTRMRGWRVAPTHFVERHGQIVIIALGEVIVEMGAGAREEFTRTSLVIVAVVLAVLSAGAMWWPTSAPSAPGARKRLQITTGIERARLARDADTYLHLPLVAGIVFLRSVCGRASPTSPSRSHPCPRPHWPAGSRCSSPRTSPTGGATITSSPATGCSPRSPPCP